jgi:glycosyltransferase involved in cell wall biosynthesis
MKILIAAASFSSNISGLQRHAFNVVRCLLPHPDISELHLAIAPWQCNLVHHTGLGSEAKLTTHVGKMERTSLSRNLWYYRKLPELAARLKIDVLHLTYPMPVNAAALHCPSVVTLHDLYPYEIPMNFGFPKFIFNRIVLQQCLRNINAIACVSDATNILLRQYASTAIWQKAVRIYNCVEAEPLCAIKSPIPGWQSEPFLLCVAQHRRNKNIPLLIRAFDRLLSSGQIDCNMKIVVIGIGGPETSNIKRLVADSGLNHRIHFLEGLSQPELQWCYLQCAALIAPSLTECFGLSIAEGILAGCRIVCSDISAHREIGDGRCRFVDLRKDSEIALATAIAAILGESKKQPTPLPQFSAVVLLKQYIELYRELLASAAPVRTVKAAGLVNISASERSSL